jgi:hypothetical protein
MATAAQIKAEVDSVILARLQGGAIGSYTLADGRNVKRDTLTEILGVRREYAAEAEADANGSSIAIFKWSDDPGIEA